MEGECAGDEQVGEGAVGPLATRPHRKGAPAEAAPTMLVVTSAREGGEGAELLLRDASGWRDVESPAAPTHAARWRRRWGGSSVRPWHRGGRSWEGRWMVAGREKSGRAARGETEE